MIRKSYSKPSPRPAPRHCPSSFALGNRGRCSPQPRLSSTRDVPDEVVAALEANAQRTGQTLAEYLRRLLADQQGPALIREQLNHFAERTADLADPEVMAAAWR